MSVVRFIALGFACSLIGGCASQQQASFLSHTDTLYDEATGLTIDLPVGWERGDPQEVKRSMIASRERFAGPGAAEVVRKNVSVLFVAYASPYDGASKDRPGLSCMATVMPPGTSPSDMRDALEASMQSTFGRFERGAVIAKPMRFEISGHEAYKASIDSKGGAWRLVKLLRSNLMIDCTGWATADSAFMSVAERALGSMRFSNAKQAL